MNTIYLIGDSLSADYNLEAYPQIGYGEILRKFKADDVVFINLSRQGCSTKSFLEQERFELVRKGIKKDDLLLVQFGNNDEKMNDSTRFIDKNTTFLDNIDYFYQTALSVGAKCIILTSPARRKYANGLMVDTHLGYPEALVDHCIKRKYTFIDLNSITLNYYNRIGERNTKAFHLIYNANEYTRFKDGVEDNSHYSLKGASFITRLILEAIKKKFKEYSNYFIEYKEEYNDFK